MQAQTLPYTELSAKRLRRPARLHVWLFYTSPGLFLAVTTVTWSGHRFHTVARAENAHIGKENLLIIPAAAGGLKSQRGR
jgi:hypothetical protein